jgi:hypothetical protein
MQVTYITMPIIATKGPIGQLLTCQMVQAFSDKR